MSEEDSESLDLSARDLMASWVTNLEKPASQQRGGKPDSDRSAKSRSKGKPDRGQQRQFDDRRSGGGGGGKGRGGRPPGNRYGGGGGRDDRDRGGPRRGGKGRDFKGKGRGGGRGDRGGFDRNRPDRQEDPLPNVEVVVQPAPQAVEALAKHIRGTGRAYALADVAKMVMQARDRYQLLFRQKKAGGKGKGEQPAEAKEPVQFFRCEGDGSVWLSRDEAIAHVLRSPVHKQFYTVEEIEVDPPKGNFTVIAVCGMSGLILGPPNHHEYQTNLARLYRERFSGMSFERYKSRIEMHRDEETLEKWKTQVSRKRVYRIGPTPEEEPADSVKETEAEAVSSEADDSDASSVDEAGAEEEAAMESGEEAAGDKEGMGSESEPEAEGEGAEAGEESETAETDEASVSGEGSDEGEPESEGASPEGAESVDEEGGEETAEAIEGEPDEDSSEEPDSESAGGEVLESEEALALHFREHYADEAVRPVSSAVVSGDIPGRDLSRSLLDKLKSEVDKLRRGFPLPMIQQLSREFEKKGLRFFKRGKKTLYVSVTRPRRIANEEAFTDRIRSIVTFVREHPRAKVVQLLDALVPDYQPPPGGEGFEDHHLTQAEHDVLGDLRWLTMEGYVIEFPSSELQLGVQDAAEKPGASKAANPPAGKPGGGAQRKARVRKKSGNRNLPRPNPLKSAAEKPKPETSESPANSDASASAAEVEKTAPTPEAEETTPTAPESEEASPAPESGEMATKAETERTASTVSETAAEPVADDKPVAESQAATESGDAASPETEKADASSAEETPAENPPESEGEDPPQETSVTS